MGPMLGRKVIEGKEDFFISLQAFAGLWKFGLVTGDELIVSGQSRLRVGARYISWISCFALPWTLLGILSRILTVLWTQQRCSGTGPYSSCRAVQKPSDPSPMASLGAADSPRRLSCPSSSRQDWVLSR